MPTRAERSFLPCLLGCFFDAMRNECLDQKQVFTYDHFHGHPSRYVPGAYIAYMGPARPGV